MEQTKNTTNRFPNSYTRYCSVRIFVAWCVSILLLIQAVSYFSYDESVVTFGRLITNILSDECPNYLTEAAKGRWITRPLSKFETDEINSFLVVARSHYGVSARLQREDMKCGNVGFPKLQSHPLLKFRALCDPKGETPCCHNFRCTAQTVQNCTCSSCYDVRSQIHAEYAQWKPSDDRCHLKNYTLTSVCELLTRASVYFVGDSYLRQMYAMMVMHVTGNYQDSTFQANVSPAQRKPYLGPFQLLCYRYLNTITKVCNNSTLLHHLEINRAVQGSAVLKLVQNLRHKVRSLVLLGQGIHNAYDYNQTWNLLLKPLVDEYNKTKQKWPKLVWIGPHSHGIMKIERDVHQSDESLRNYIEVINKLLRENGIPVFDTAPMTENVMAYDGAHYGIGVNMLKIQVIYNYLEDLQKKTMW